MYTVPFTRPGKPVGPSYREVIDEGSCDAAEFELLSFSLVSFLPQDTAGWIFLVGVQNTGVTPFRNHHLSVPAVLRI